MARGNEQLDWVQALAVIASERGLRMIIDRPQNSLLWKQPGWEVCSAENGWTDCLVDLCRFGAAARKATRLRARGCLENKALRCSCRERHLQLRGRSPGSGLSWTLEGAGHPKSGT